MNVEQDEFRSFFELSLDLFLIVDLDGVILKANKSWKEALGYAPSDLVGQSLFKFVHQDDQAVTNDKMNLSAQGKDIQHFENHWVSADGSVRTLRWRSRVDDQKGLVFGVAVDVTAERRNVEELNAAKLYADLQRERLYSLLMQVPAMAAVLMGPNHVFELANDRYRKLFGEREIIGKSVAESVPNLEQKTLDNLDNVFKTGQRFVGKHIAIGADWEANGRFQHKIFDFVYEPILDSSGKTEGIWVWAIEVTEQLMMERQLRISDRLSSIGRVAAGVAHEINNPLAFALNNIELALASPLLPEKARGFLTSSLNGVERVAAIVKGLKVFSRVDDTKIEDIDVRSEVESAISITDHELKKVGANLRCSITGQPTIRASRGSLCQIIMNLLVNSAHAVKGRPRKEIELEIASAANGEVVFKITDSGCGMSCAQLEKIFEPFVTFKPAGEGTGLGLSIVHGLVTSLNGKLDVQSQPDRGTRFQINLPAAVAERLKSVATLATPVAPEANGLTVLVIDDEEEIRNVLSWSLPEHAIVTAGSLDEAFGILEAGRCLPDVILCDVALGAQSGRDFYEQLMKVRPELGARVIFMTGGATDESTVRWLDSIPNRILTKPFKLRELKESLFAHAKKAG